VITKFFRIDCKIWEIETLSFMEKAILQKLTDLSNNGDGCTAGNAYLGEFFGVSGKTISRYVKRLEAAGALESILKPAAVGVTRIIKPRDILSISKGTNCPDPLDKLSRPQGTNCPGIKIGNIKRVIKRRKEPPLTPLRGKPALSFDFIDDMDWKALFKKWATNKKSPYKKQVGLEAGFSKLRNMTQNDIAKARAVINESFANNWAGLFPLDDDQDGVDEEYEAMRRKRRLGEI